MANKIGVTVSDRSTLIDCLRAVAILLVLVTHFAPTLPSTAQDNPALFMRTVAPFGYYGVGLFFTVSGYIITRRAILSRNGAFHPDIFGFYVRRISRIWPLLCVALLIGAAALFWHGGKLFGFIFDSGENSFDVAFLLSLFTFTFNWLRFVRGGHWGLQWDVLWSLSVEEQFYLIYPWLFLWARRVGRLRWILIGVIFAGLVRRGMLLDRRIDSFTAFLDSTYGFVLMSPGILGAFLAVKLRAEPGRQRLFMAVGAMLSLTGIALIWWYVEILIANVLAPLVMASGIAILMAGSESGGFSGAIKPLHRLVSLLVKPWALIGEVSYGLYLLHPAVLFLLAPWLAYLNPLPGFVLFLVIAVIVSWISHVCFEQPAQRLIRQWWRRRRLRRAPAETTA